MVEFTCSSISVVFASPRSFRNFFIFCRSLVVRIFHLSFFCPDSFLSWCLTQLLDAHSDTGDSALLIPLFRTVPIRVMCSSDSRILVMSEGLFAESICLASQTEISIVFRGRSDRYFRINLRRLCESIPAYSSKSNRPHIESVTDRTAGIDITVLHLTGSLRYK